MDWDFFEHDGRAFARATVPDEDHGAPWEEEDGHGPVSEWTARAKLPGELVLCEDHGCRRYYDFAAACRIARRDSWGFLPGPLHIEKRGDSWHASCAGVGHDYISSYVNRAIAAIYREHRESMTPRAYAAGAARADYERLRRWCADLWGYVGVVVAPLDEDGDPDESRAASLWGVESDATDYLDEVSHELAAEIGETCNV